MLSSQVAHLQMLSAYGPHTSHSEYVEYCNDCYHLQRELDDEDRDVIRISDVIDPSILITKSSLKQVIKIHVECIGDYVERDKRWANLEASILDPHNEYVPEAASEESSEDDNYGDDEYMNTR
jgi:hypothetical protein